VAYMFATTCRCLFICSGTLAFEQHALRRPRCVVLVLSREVVRASRQSTLQVKIQLRETVCASVFFGTFCAYRSSFDGSLSRDLNNL
jgi:hypothetical protein